MIRPRWRLKQKQCERASVAPVPLDLLGHTRSERVRVYRSPPLAFSLKWLSHVSPAPLPFR